MLARALGHHGPREHPGDLVDSRLRVETRDAGLAPALALYLINAVVGGREARDLREVGDADDLVDSGEILELFPDRVGDAAPDAGIHLVEDQGLPPLAFRGDGLQSEDEAGELAPRSGFGEGPGVLPRIGGEEELG